MSEHEHTWTGMAAPFVIGALDAEEHSAFEAHLSTCAECRAAVRSYSDVAADLAATVPRRAPPAGLRARVLEEARRVRPLGGAGREAGGGARAGEAGSGRQPAAPARRAGPWLAAASVVLALIALTAYVEERAARQELTETVGRLTGEARSSSARIAELEAGLARRDSVLDAVLSADVETARLTAQGQPPSARIYWNRGRGRIVVAAFALAPAPAGRTYQLWGITGGQAPVSLGVFNTAADGSATVTLPVDPELRFEVAAVTEEPAGGSPQPTTTPFLVGGVGSP